MKRGILVVCSLFLAASVANAEQDVKKEGFWNKLQNKLEKVTPAKKAGTTTAVGGVRGAKNDDATDIYWKGKDKSLEMAEEEMQKFNLAVESKLKGDNEQALKQFEEFLLLYPQSSFRVEGLQAVENIKQEIAAAKAPVLKDAPAAPAAAPVEPAPAAAPAAPPAAEAAPASEAAPQPAR